MRLKRKMTSATNRLSAFTLIEVLITVAVLSTAILFVFRSFASSLSAAKVSQNITLICYLAEEEFFDIQNNYANKKMLQGDGSQVLQERNFNWNYGISDTDNPDLKELKLLVLWKEATMAKEYSLEFLTLLPANK